MSRREVYRDGRLIEWSELQGAEHVRAWLDGGTWREERRPATTDETTQAAATVNAATIRDRAAGALAANRTYLSLASPTAAQTAAQVRALTRQVSALVRLELSQFDAAD